MAMSAEHRLKLAARPGNDGGSIWMEILRLHDNPPPLKNTFLLRGNHVSRQENVHLDFGEILVKQELIRE